MNSKDDQPEDLKQQDNSEVWLISYADMMTLIACFFILMMAFAHYDPVGFDKKAKDLSQAFNQSKFKPSEVRLNQLTEEIAKHPELLKKTKITVHDSEIAITISGSIIFKEGSYNIDENIIAQIDTLVDIIRTRNPLYNIIIEGHTDPFEHQKNKRLSSAWDLGALRATKLLSRFEYYGFNPQQIVAISKGDSYPALPPVNDSGIPIESNNELNRRVIIKIIEPASDSKKIKFGLGIYFNE